MKKYLLLFIVLSFTTIDVSAQKFLRYYLQDSVYHGFYTDEIDSIVNDVDYTIIYARDSSFRISVSNIDSVVVEAATIDEDTVVNYRIYEFNIDDSAYPFRKIIVDNRASLLVSTNGTFDGDDTVLIYSAYYGVQMFCILDSLGRIRELYDTANLVLFDYTEDSCNMVVFERYDSIWQELTTPFDVRDTRPIAKDLRSAVASFLDYLFRLSGTEGRDLMGLGLGFVGNKIMSNVEMMRDAYDRPDNYAGRIGVDIAGIIRDGIGVGASVAGEPFTGGLSTTVLALSTKSLFDDFKGLVNDMFPDDERMQRYKDYYRDHYGIALALQPVEVLGSCGAVLSANLYTSSKNLGNVGFHVLQTNPFDADNSFVYRSDRIDTIAPGRYKLGTVVSGLTPNTEYNCSILDYSININGLKLTFFVSDDIFQSNDIGNGFITGEPSITTEEAVFNAGHIDFSYSLTCVCDNCIYGIEYQYNSGNDSSMVIEIAHNPNNDTIQTITLSNVPRNRMIRYRAFAKANNTYTYGEYDSIYIPAGGFSIGMNRQVQIAPGNLQFQSFTNTWRFAEHQYDYIGDAPGNNTVVRQCLATVSKSYYGEYPVVSINGCLPAWITGESCDNHSIEVFTHPTVWDESGLISIDFAIDSVKRYKCRVCTDSIRNCCSSDWIDLFAYGATGYNGYNPGTLNQAEVPGDIDGTHYDWGVHCNIQNATPSSGWRTPTAAEWDTIIHRRGLSGLAIVNGIKGVVLLPDDWHNDSITFYSDTNSYTFYWDSTRYNAWWNYAWVIHNEYTLSQWDEMELNGAIFLPAAGELSIYNDSIYFVDIDFPFKTIGGYWASKRPRVDYNGPYIMGIQCGIDVSHFTNPSFVRDSHHRCGWKYCAIGQGWLTWIEVYHSVRLVRDL